MITVAVRLWVLLILLRNWNETFVEWSRDQINITSVEENSVKNIYLQWRFISLLCSLQYIACSWVWQFLKSNLCTVYWYLFKVAWYKACYFNWKKNKNKNNASMYGVTEGIQHFVIFTHGLLLIPMGKKNVHITHFNFHRHYLYGNYN